MHQVGFITRILQQLFFEALEVYGGQKLRKELGTSSQ
jgi:hypothetical protein